MNAESEQVLIALNKLQKQRDLEMTVSESVNDLIADLDCLEVNKKDLIKSLMIKDANFSTLNAKY